MVTLVPLELLVILEARDLMVSLVKLGLVVLAVKPGPLGDRGLLALMVHLVMMDLMDRRVNLD